MKWNNMYNSFCTNFAENRNIDANIPNGISDFSKIFN